MLNVAAIVLLAAAVANAQCPADPVSFYLDQSGVNNQTHNSMMAWAKNQVVWFFDFGPFSAPAGPQDSPASLVSKIPILVPKYANGTSAGANIIDILPCQPGYSDLWDAMLVNITDLTVPFNYYNDAAQVQKDVDAKKITVTSLNTLVNCPVVPFNSTAVDKSPNSPPMNPNPVTGWFKGKKVFYFDFGAVKPAYVKTQGVWHIFTPSGASEGPGLFDDISTPFWNLLNVTVPENLAGSNSIKSVAAVQAANYPIVNTNLIVNCPIVFPKQLEQPAASDASPSATASAPVAASPSQSASSTKAPSSANAGAGVSFAVAAAAAFVLAAL